MEPNDTLLTATQTSIRSGDIGTFTFSGVIGDNSEIGSVDEVDLYALELSENTRVVFDVSANSPNRISNSILRVFDTDGNELANSEEDAFTDSYIGFLPPASGIYYIGVSGDENLAYSPSIAGSGTSFGATGNYTLSITTSLFKESGLASGARLVKDIKNRIDANNSSDSNAYNFTEFDGQLLFTADDGTTGRELWVTDGTTDGTQLLKDINPGLNSYGVISSSDIYSLNELDGKLFFGANDGTTGRELWVSDGTTDGTQLLKDIRPGLNSNGQPAGSNVSSFTEFDGQLLFTADDGTTGRELWVTDGTTDGTQLLKDINPGLNYYSEPSGSFPSNLFEFNGKLFFSASDETTNQELWVSDGTTEGTQLLKDINTTVNDNGFSNSSPSNFTEFDGRIFFSASDGITGQELWVSDGTAKGTRLFKDINPGSSSSRPSGSLFKSQFFAIDGKLFFAADDGINGQELWVSDGTSEGTQLVKNINPGSSRESKLFDFTEFDGRLFFAASDGTTGQELWASDGTAEGTQLVKDINPRNISAIDDGPLRLTVAGDFLFFNVDDGFTGRELWVTDGTNEGTQLFQNVNAGPSDSDSSFPQSFKVIGDQLYFTADDGITGNELWVATIPDNIISGDENNNVLNGTDENDLLNGFGGDDVIRGQGNNDIINGGNGNDVLFGDLGNDGIDGGKGNDQIFGDQGDDNLKGGDGNDLIEGGDGDDTVTVNDFSGVDSFDGGAGNDLIRFDPIDGRNLTVFLKRGNVGDGRRGGQFFTNFEQIMTGRGNDSLLGDVFANSLNGGSGNDELVGDEGKDTLIGGQGDDTLSGGTGDDIQIGNEGVDTFVFGEDLLDSQRETDTIQNFQSEDVLDFSDYIAGGGSIDVTRVAEEFLRIDLRGEDTVNVFGSANALDAAETQL